MYLVLLFNSTNWGHCNHLIGGRLYSWLFTQHDQGVEFRTTKNRVEDLKQGPPDLKNQRPKPLSQTPLPSLVTGDTLSFHSHTLMSQSHLGHNCIKQYHSKFCSRTLT